MSFDIPQPYIGRAIDMSQPRISACERPDPERPKTFSWMELHLIEALVIKAGLDPTLAFGHIFRMASADMTGSVIQVHGRQAGGKVIRRQDEIVAKGTSVEDALAADPDISPEMRQTLMAQMAVIRRTAQERRVDSRADEVIEVDGSIRVGKQRTRRQVEPRVGAIRRGPKPDQAE